MAEPGNPNAAADSGGIVRKLQDGLAWFNRQSENSRIGIIVAASIIGPIGLIAIYSFLSDNLVTILVVFASLGLLSSLGGLAFYLRLRRQQKSEEQQHLAGHQQACPSCAEWNDQEAEFCRNCARPFKDQKMLAEFLAYRDRKEAQERESRRSSPPPSPAPEPAAMQVPVVQERRDRFLSLSARSFTGPALITMLLYLFLCWPVGVTANLIWLSEAERLYRTTGVSPSGRGCLKVLGIVFILVPFVLGVVIALVVYLHHQGVPVVPTPQ